MNRPDDQSLTGYIEARRRQVDAALEAWLPQPPACPPVVIEAMRYSVLAGGKRFRPILCLASAEAVAGQTGTAGAPPGPGAGPHVLQLAMPAACAIEWIHTYSLIHDDLPAMDNDTLRRGRPTLHVVYGEGIAILAGDGLLAEAFALLAREPQSSDPGIVGRKLRVVRAVAEAAGATGMVGGQALDMQAAPEHVADGEAVRLDADGLRMMHGKKTGALIRASAASGAIMAGADERLLGAVDQYASELGLAFQIVDDILDVAGTSAEMGKTAGKDAASGKPTYPALYGLDQSRRLAADCVARANAVLDEAGLGGGRLSQIAQWVVSRTK